MPPLDPESLKALAAKWKKNTQESTLVNEGKPPVSGGSAERALTTDAQKTAEPRVQVNDPDLFYNPYHFVPVCKPDWGKNCVTVADFKDCPEKGFYTHSKYAEGKLSGRLVCRLTNEDPFFIGCKREENGDDSKPKKVFPFELEEGRPAIPASSLRGLLSSIVEAASNSSMRVLNDGILSFRKEMNPDEALSALGMVVIEKEEYRLRPLSMPTLSESRNGGYRLDPNYKNIFKEPLLKVYIGNYKVKNDNSLTGKETFTFENKKYYYMKLKKDWKFENEVLKKDDLLRYPKSNKDTRFIIGQSSMNDSAPIPEDDYKTKDENEKKLYVRGILRVLGVKGRDIPSNKKHELFIPYPETDEIRPSYKIEDAAIRRFNLLADERTRATENKEKKESLFPYEPFGTIRNNGKDEDKKNLRLKDGDIVYFKAGDSGKITEVSFSSIWRDCVKDEDGVSPATVHSFFEKIGSELLPFNSARKWISPAELLFGFVQEDNSNKKNSDKNEICGALAMAGCVRVSFGKLKEDATAPFYEDEVTLKILSSPKPPCPSMYFKNKEHFKNKDQSMNYIQKSKLSIKKHEPQGRKVYLHRYENDNEPWRSHPDNLDPKQQVRITPVKREREFYFHIDFNNLSKWELGLLCYAVRPSDDFRHKIGMGKPIGLGKSRIDPLGMFFINRKARYKTDVPSKATRYHFAWVAENEKPESWHQVYKTEIQYAGMEGMKKYDISFKKFRASFIKEKKAEKARKALECLGKPANVKYPVRTPQLCYGMLEETYRWFVTNDKGSYKKDKQSEPIPVWQQALTPFDDKDQGLPTLHRHPCIKNDFGRK